MPIGDPTVYNYPDEVVQPLSNELQQWAQDSTTSFVIDTNGNVLFPLFHNPFFETSTVTTPADRIGQQVYPTTSGYFSTIGTGTSLGTLVSSTGTDGQVLVAPNSWSYMFPDPLIAPVDTEPRYTEAEWREKDRLEKLEQKKRLIKPIEYLRIISLED